MRIVFTGHSFVGLFVVGCTFGYFFTSGPFDPYTPAEQRVITEPETNEQECAQRVNVEDDGEYRRHPRILCWLLVSPENVLKAKLINETWGRKCDKLLFMGSTNDNSLAAISLPVKESPDLLWEKAKLSLEYIYIHHLYQFDWFFKADIDTYAIVENLRRFISPFPTSLPFFLGRQFKHSGVTYLSGAAGFVLSRETLRRVVEKGLNGEKCRVNPGEIYEDVNLGKCVKEIGGLFADLKDESGRHRFVPYYTSEFFSGQSKNIDFLKHNDIDFQLGYDCCSTEAITFHCNSQYDMQIYEYLFYRLKIAN